MGGDDLCETMHEVYDSIWKEEEMPKDWSKVIIIPYVKGDKLK